MKFKPLTLSPSHPRPRRWLAALLALCCLLGSPGVSSQDSSARITTVLLPLHIDSLFQGNTYRFGNSIPRFALPYLEFYNGVLLAKKELETQGIAATIQVIDSRRGGGLAAVLNDFDTRRSHLLIGVARDAAELRLMADFAKKQQIPFVSATYPNDGGIRANSRMAIVNSTLRTHCAGLVRYLQHHHASEKITVLTRKGSAESYLNQWLDEAAAQSALSRPNWKRTTLVDSFAASQLLPYLDSTRQNTIVVSSLDAGFGQRVLKQLAGFKGKYPCTVVGMPTWDEFDLRKPEFRGLNVVYSTPFEAYSTNVDLHKALTTEYELMANSKPSDMALKGYEYTYRFVKQLALLPEGKNLFESGFGADPKSFCELRLQPVREKDSEQVNYYENQKLYFVRKTDGVVKGIY